MVRGLCSSRLCCFQPTVTTCSCCECAAARFPINDITCNSSGSVVVAGSGNPSNQFVLWDVRVPAASVMRWAEPDIGLSVFSVSFLPAQDNLFVVRALIDGRRADDIVSVFTSPPRIAPCRLAAHQDF